MLPSRRRVLLCALLVVAAASPLAQSRHPNALVIVLDDISARDLPGLPLPALEEFGRRGVVFQRAYAMPVCYPARRTMLSGEIWPDRRGGVPCEPSTIPGPGLGDLPLPELFRGAGYQTAGFGKWHLGAAPGGLDWPQAPAVHGFDTWRAGIPANVYRCLDDGRMGNYRFWERMDDGHLSVSSTYQTQALVDAFLGWWPRARGPRMGWVAVQAAHEPFHRPIAEFLPPDYPPTPNIRAKFEATVVSADVALERMLAAVDLNRTYVVVLADNGTPPDVAPDPNKAKGTTFERGVHVPMAIAGPGIRPGVSQSPVHIVDVFETLRELCGLDRRTPVRDSVSLVPCLSDPSYRPRPYVFVQLEDDLAVISTRFKLREKAGVQAFYDLAADPLEEHPIPLDDSKLATTIAKHRTWLDSERRPVAPPDDAERDAAGPLRED